MTSSIFALGILATDSLITNPTPRNELAQMFEVHDFSAWREMDETALLQHCRSVDVLVTGWGSPHLPPGLLEDRGRLQWVAHCRGSIRHVVSRTMIEQGLWVTNWGPRHGVSVAEGALALLLSQLKQISAFDRVAKGGPDERVIQDYPTRIEGLRVGLYGFGPIGRFFADLALALGIQLSVYDPFAKDLPPKVRRCDSLPELFASNHAISIHCGLNDATRGSVNAELLALLPQGGIVINTARGAIIDETALGRMLTEKRLLAAVDVVADESQPWTASPLAVPASVMTLHKVASGYQTNEQRNADRPLPPYLRGLLETFASGNQPPDCISPEEYDLKT